MCIYELTGANSYGWNSKEARYVYLHRLVPDSDIIKYIDQHRLVLKLLKNTNFFLQLLKCFFQAATI